MTKLLKGRNLLLVVTLLSTTAVIAKQNNYQSGADRIRQEIRDGARGVQASPQRGHYDTHQSIKNKMYGGSDTRGYKLDAYGNRVPLNR